MSEVTSSIEPNSISQDAPTARKQRFISIFTPCYNEEDNVREWYQAVKSEMEKEPDYTYEHVFIDNHSTDKTWEYLKEICANDKNVKAIRNTRNFGQVRSPYHGILQCSGECVIALVCDFQDPPEMIHQYLRKWEEGYKVVLGVKRTSAEMPIMFWLRKLYYKVLNSISDVEQVQNATGSGVLDQEVLKVLRSIDDKSPYLRGLLPELGFKLYKLPYDQPVRVRGFTKNNFFTLYDFAMLGLTSHSKAPLRLATFAGFGMSAVSMGIAIFYLIMKLTFWQNYPVGVAPMLISIFFFSSIQLFFIGILGEYISAIHLHSLNRPIVVEEQRLNFTANRQT